MKKIFRLAFLLLAITAFGQFSWPTYPVTAPIQIYKAVIDNGSGVVVTATNDSTLFAGVTQAAVVTSSGNVPLATQGPTQIQNAATGTLTMGELVTSDAHGNATAFVPASDGAQHCVLGSVVGLGSGAGAPGTYVYIRILPFCYTKSSGSGAVSSVFGRTGAVVATSGDYTVSQVTGAAPLASPAFTGTATAVNLTVTGACVGCSAPTLSFADITNGVAVSTMEVGSGGSLSPNGSGTITATSCPNCTGVMQIASVTLTAAQVNALSVTPVTIVAAPSAGQYIYPISAVYEFKFGSVAFLGTGGTWSLQPGTAANGPEWTDDGDGFLTTSSQLFQTAPSAQNVALATALAAPLTITSSSAYTGGTGCTVTVTVYYQTITAN